MGWSPKESVVNDEEIGFGANRKFHSCQGSIHRGRDAGHGAAIFDLQTVRGSLVIFYVGGAQDALAMLDNHLQRCICHARIKTEWSEPAKQGIAIQSLSY